MKLIPALMFMFLMLGPNQPKLTVNDKNFTVNFDKGAVYANIAYKNKDNTSYDNYFLSTKVSSLTDVVSSNCDKCTIVASIGYPGPDPANEGTTLVTYVESNIVKVN